jgi:hypothetical protein
MIKLKKMLIKKKKKSKKSWKHDSSGKAYV